MPWVRTKRDPMASRALACFTSQHEIRVSSVLTAGSVWNWGCVAVNETATRVGIVGDLLGELPRVHQYHYRRKAVENPGKCLSGRMQAGGKIVTFRLPVLMFTKSFWSVTQPLPNVDTDDHFDNQS
jgi:hypothetical protein